MRLGRTDHARSGVVRRYATRKLVSLAELKRLFEDDHKVLVELGCAATLTTAYSRELFDKLVPRVPGQKPTVIFIVCGGFKVWLASMDEYRRIADAEPQDGMWDVLCNCERWKIARPDA